MSGDSVFNVLLVFIFRTLHVIVACVVHDKAVCTQRSMSLGATTFLVLPGDRPSDVGGAPFLVTSFADPDEKTDARRKTANLHKLSVQRTARDPPSK